MDQHVCCNNRVLCIIYNIHIYIVDMCIFSQLYLELQYREMLESRPHFCGVGISVSGSD